MNKKIIAIILAIVIIAGVSGTVAYQSLIMPASTATPTPTPTPTLTPTPTPTSRYMVPTPPLLYDDKISVINPQVTEVSGYIGFFNNVSQGLPLEVNVTFTSLTNLPIIIPIENLTVTYYNSTVDLHSWINNNINYSLIQQQAFNYFFSLNQLTLQPNMSNSTLLTINLAQNAPIGQYSIDINLGNVQAVNANENSQLLSYSGTLGLEIIVTPKTT